MAMEKFLVVTIDVEPDCTPTWHYSNPLTFEGVSLGIRKRLQPLFNRYGVVPTYLINNVVLEDKNSVQIFQNLEGKFELGTHLHGEFVEPDKKYFDYAGKKGEANQCAYPMEVEYAKMHNITRLFQDAFDYAPTSFRAGRFSAGKNTIRILDELGYKVDTSVTPHVNWNDKSRDFPVNYRDAIEQPYLIKKDSYLENDPRGTILEVPVTIRRGNKFLRKRTKWLRPVFSDFEDFKSIYNYYCEAYRSAGKVVFNIMFHNVEVLPKASPYTLTEQDCEKYLQLLDNFFELLSRSGTKMVGLSDLYAEYK